MKKSILCIFISVIATVSCFPDELLDKQTNTISSELLRLHNGLLEGIYVTKGEERFLFGFFGGTTEFENTIMSCAPAKKSYGSFKLNRAFSSTFVMSGLACAVGGCVYIGMTSYYQQEINPWISLLFGTGFVFFEAIGSIFVTNGNNDLFDVVWSYNKSVSGN
jgi:hypothetical protein